MKNIGCQRFALTYAVVWSPGKAPKELGPSVPPENNCGKEFERFILAERGIHLCRNCCDFFLVTTYFPSDFGLAPRNS